MLGEFQKGERIMSKDGMKLEEAIRSLQEDGKHVVRAALSLQGGTVLDKAIQLGIEALGRVQYWREKVAKNPKARPSLEELQALLPSEEE